MTSLMWFRRDLRLGDNPAWSDATRRHDRVVALFVIDPSLTGVSPRRDTLLFAHLRELDRRLRERGGALKIRRGDPRRIVVQEASHAEAVYWNEDAGPYATRRDDDVAGAIGAPARIHPGLTVHAPGEVRSRAGSPYRVFTPFHRAWSQLPWDTWDPPGPAGVVDDPGDGLPDTDESPIVPGEAGAHDRLQRWLQRVDGYEATRNHLEPGSTSELSADLHFGTLDARRVRAEVGDHTPGRVAFVRQLAWRDFSFHALRQFPDAARSSIRPEYTGIEWRDDPEGFEAWAAGMTGYPIVDAAMRQLAAEGWMPNRLRMIAASFLVKDLLVDWRLGERHFRRELRDGDLAQNTINWQWVAGTGLDAAPYFRVFNPVLQGRTHDPDGEYVRRWVPELAGIDGPAIHAPWELGPLELAAAGVTLGIEYPGPIVDHAVARDRTIDAYQRAAGSSKDPNR